MVVARLLRLIFLRKILARKHATFHIQTRCSTFMKNVITLILVLILSSCASKKITERKDKADFTFVSITESFDVKKVNYIGLKKYCVGGVRIEMPNEKDCRNCYSENDIYIFWNENGKSYVQKFDNCSEFNIIEISNFQPTEFLKNNTTELLTEKVKRYKVDKDTYSTVSHSCFRNYILNDGQKKYENEFDIYDLTDEEYNLNFQANNKLRLIQLDKKLSGIITELESENRFVRNKKSSR